MTYEEFQKCSHFGPEELIALLTAHWWMILRRASRPGFRRRLF